MIGQITFVVLVSLTGWLICRRITAWNDCWAPCVVSFQVGLVVYCSTHFLMFGLIDLLHLPGRYGLYITFIVMIMFAVVFSYRAPKFRMLCFRNIGITLLFGSLLIFLSQYFNFSTGTFDTFHYMEVGEIISEKIFAESNNSYPSLGTMFYPLLHSISPILGIEYIWSLPAVFSVSFIWVFWYFGIIILKHHDILPPHSTALIFVAIVLLLSNYYFVLQIFYLNHHFFTAVYFCVFFMLAWIGLRTQDQQILIIATFLLLATIMMRHENMLLTPIFIFLLLQQSAVTDRSFRIICLMIGVFIVVYSLLYAFILSKHPIILLGPDHFYFAAVFGGLIIVGCLLTFIPYSSKIVRWLRVRTDHILTWVLLLAVTSMIFLRYDQVINLTAISLGNAIAFGNWSSFWWGVCGILLVTNLVPAPRSTETEMIRTALQIFFIGLIGLFAITDWAYRLSWSHAGNRILFHIAPTAMLYVLLSVGASVTRSFKSLR